jgi:FKBP-type peptidyl-prolyl cis-trans isomerase
MKLLKLFVVLLLIVSIASAQNKKEAKEKKSTVIELKTQSDSLSYAIGQNIFMQLKELGLDVEILARSIKDGAEGKSTLPQDKIVQVLTAFQTKMQEKQAADMKVQEEQRKAEMKPLIDKNIKEGAAFLHENGLKEGVKTTSSGLQYKVLVAGPGAGSTPKDTSKVKVHYKGTFIDGKEFDSSYKRNQPAEFPLNQVIKGWTEGLQLMHVGDKYQFWVPYQLGYGEEGRGENIPPASVLIFEVELLEIK